MAKLTPLNPAMFDPDALEQIFAKGVTARDNTAGLSAAWLLAQGDSRLKDQDRYLGAMNNLNQMDAALQRQEIAAKLREQGMKSATALIKEGFKPSTLNAGGDVFNDIPGGDSYSGMLQELTRSKIFANMNKGAGGGAKESTTVQSTMMPWGAAGPTVVTSKGSNPQNAYSANAAALANVVNDMKKNPGKYTEDQKRAVTQQLIQQTNQRQPNIED
jgi:hypothetical protein